MARIEWREIRVLDWWAGLCNWIRKRGLSEPLYCRVEVAFQRARWQWLSTRSIFRNTLSGSPGMSLPGGFELRGSRWDHWSGAKYGRLVSWDHLEAFCEKGSCWFSGYLPIGCKIIIQDELHCVPFLPYSVELPMDWTREGSRSQPAGYMSLSKRQPNSQHLMMVLRSTKATVVMKWLGYW